MQFIREVLSLNQILTVSLLSWLVAQVLKTLINFILLGKFQLERMWGDGGMPSAHSATVCAMVIATARSEGINSAIFAVAAVVAIITMHDAMGVRRETGEQAAFDYLIKWFDEHIERGLPGKNVNSMSPCLTLSFLWEHTGNEKYLEICREWAEYAMYKLPRTTEGGIQHVTIDSDNYQQLWDDTLYMTVLFLSRMGRLLKKDEYVQESAKQFLVHVKYLSDLKTGLFFHGWSFESNDHFAGALWGRGNAWYTAGLVDYLDLAEIPACVRDFLVSALDRQTEALERYQDADGFWHTLIDHMEDSYAESSATAGFAYGIMKAARLGYIPASRLEMGRRGLAAVLSQIDEKGIVHGVSAGTCLRGSLDYYRGIRLSAQPYGQSMALLAITEALSQEGSDTVKKE